MFSFWRNILLTLFTFIRYILVMLSFLRSKPKSCIFCQIAYDIPIVEPSENPNHIRYHDDLFYVLEDNAPATDTHLLAIPLRHIADANALKPDDIPLVRKMQAKLREILAEDGYEPSEISMGFHLPPFISVPHLHLHAMAPVAKMSILGEFKFTHNTLTYCTVENAIEKISKRNK